MKSLNSGFKKPAGAKVLGLLLALLVLMLQLGVAFAHARLKSSNILPESTVATAPATLTLTFTEQTSPDQTKVSVTDSSGKQVDKGDLKIKGDTATVSLGTLPNGKYTVTFRTLTEDDGGILNGNFSFTVGGTATTGDLASAKQEESSVPGAPNAGQGGRVSSSSNNSLPGDWLAIGLLIGLTAGASTVLNLLARRKGN